MVMKKECDNCGKEFETENKFTLCVECAEAVREENYKERLQWEENMNNLYHWDEGGFCDGFTQS
jgi:predicted amidophosphoribosyltransferase